MPGKKPAKRASQPEDIKSTKKVKVSHSSHGREVGQVLVLGQGDVGQLGLGEDVMERKKPALVSLPEGVLQAVAGGMHTVCLSETGNVSSASTWTSLGEALRACRMSLQVLPVGGSVMDNNGVIGLLEPMKKCTVPVQVPLEEPVIKIASALSAHSTDPSVALSAHGTDPSVALSAHGTDPSVALSAHGTDPSNDHLVMLTLGGDLYSSGCGEQGQLGRVPERFANRGGRKGLRKYPTHSQNAPPHCRHPKIKHHTAVTPEHSSTLPSPQNTAAHCPYFTFAVSKEGHVYGFGLSNYHQLGTSSTNTCFSPVKLTAFKNSTTSWVSFSGGQHHTVCLDSEGKVYSLGRAEYGRLGLGQGAEEKSLAFAWGMGTNLQLGTGEEDDEWSPILMSGKQLENRAVLSVSSGGQHTVLLVKDKQES
ncbi:hypothetical protein JZ751_021416 [Albula glossodonta]|uniref:Regulator of chromosome condensation n=1 Tax=Albula glossodonta TaxID=121402 RepID=A0A8T2MS93_9TELE|nr:hypothetical protein JZ751_021416 [Albula glossodonta]